MAKRQTQVAARQTVDADAARMLAVIDNLNDAVLVVDSAGRTIFCNPPFASLFDDTLELHCEGHRVALGELRGRAAAGESFELALTAKARDGGERWFELRARPVQAGTGISEGGAIIAREISDARRRRLQEEFVGIVAHELRTPLTALRGYLQMLHRDLPDGDGDHGPMLPLAIEQADRLDRLVRELFDVTLAGRRTLAIEPAPIALAPLIRDTVDVVRGLSQAQDLRIEASEVDLVVLADRARLQQVLLNVLTNAVVHAADSPTVLIRLRGLPGFAQIEIEDHGPGIPPELQARLFSRFERGAGPQRPGLGLGLYIAREIVGAHGGTIEVSSRPGDGTTFTIRLPLTARTLPATAKPPSADGKDGADRSNGRNGTRKAPPVPASRARARTSPRKSGRGGD